MWRKYGFLLAWAVAVWGLTLCLRMLPMAIMGFTAGEIDWFFSIRMVLLWLSPGASVTAAGTLLARRWQKAGHLRRQDLGWALALGGGIMLSAYLLAVLADWVAESYAIVYNLRYALWPAIPLALGLLLALLPPWKHREEKSE